MALTPYKLKALIDGDAGLPLADQRAEWFRSPHWNRFAALAPEKELPIGNRFERPSKRVAWHLPYSATRIIRLQRTMTMTKLVPDIEPPEKPKPVLEECPHCSGKVEGFQVDALSRNDVVITLQPCGCASHASDGHFKKFADLVKGSGIL
jgi:hypothetical protein